MRLTLFFLLLLLLAAAAAAAASASASATASASGRHHFKIPQAGGDDETCVYTIYIRTGSIWKGGTDSKISLAIAESDGSGVQITDLEDWGGLMGEGHNYFERGNLDIFSGLGPCLSSPPCWMNLTSDGSGAHHGWYCNYVEVTTTGPHSGCAQIQFDVEQWIATDTSPYQLYAARDYCPTSDDGGAAGTRVLRGVAGRRERVERG